MKKFILILFVACLAMAGVEEPFVQFYNYCEPHTLRSDQNWFGAQLISLNVTAGNSLWLTNYVKSWYEPIADLGNVYQMSGENKYGYIYKNDIAGLNVEKASYADLIHWSDGETTEVTYYADSNPALKQSTTGYLVDYFDENAEIYLVMTTLQADGGETVDSYQYVQDGVHDTTLVSRQHNTTDLAGNVRVNFGIDSDSEGLIAREFVAVYNRTEDIGGGMSGQPLPGMLTSCLVALGSIGLTRRFKKKNN